MATKPLILRRAAEGDIVKSFNHYLQEAGKPIATAFIEKIDALIQHIQDYPGSGSQRYGELLEMPGLRSSLTSGYPYMLFYIERDDYIDAIRLLHQHSDIPEQLV